MPICYISEKFLMDFYEIWYWYTTQEFKKKVYLHIGPVLPLFYMKLKIKLYQFSQNGSSYKKLVRDIKYTCN